MYFRTEKYIYTNTHKEIYIERYIAKYVKFRATHTKYRLDINFCYKHVVTLIDFASWDSQLSLLPVSQVK